MTNMSNRYTRSGTKTGNRDYNGDFIQIRITYEAYHMLSTYLYLKHGRVKGRMPYIVSDLLIKAITNEMPEIIELKKKYGTYTKTQEDTESSIPKTQKASGLTDQKTSGAIDQSTERPPQASSRPRSEKSVFDRWMVKYAGILDGIQNMSKMEKEAKELKFLFYPVGKDRAVVVDRYWINKAIELANNPKFKIGLGRAEEIAKAVIEGGKKDEELSLVERIGLALFMLNKDGYTIYSSTGWTLAIPDIALDVSGKEKPTPQAPKPEAQKTEEKKPEAEPEAKKEESKPEPKQEDICSEKKIPDTQDLDFVRVDGAVEQITIRECAERKGYHFYMLVPELGVVVNPKFEDDLLEKIRNGQIKYARADIDNVVESYVKNRAKSLGLEEKQKILMKVLLQEAKLTYTNGEWKVVEKPKTSKTEAKAGVKTGSMIDNIQGV
ncbi:MAG: hypothetical protein QXU60_07180 [Sulfolobales archaeon]